MDHSKIEEGVRLILEGIGEDPSREGLCDTPGRVAHMCEEIFGGYESDPKVPLSVTFHMGTGSGPHMEYNHLESRDGDCRAEDEGSQESDGIVIEKDIPFYSVCEHHLLPFFGTVSIGYIPDGKVVGLSKLARTVEIYARRAQIQERMTTQIAEAITDHLNPRGVIVMVEAEHMCMSMRGVKKPGTKTLTYKTTGCFNDEGVKNTFFSILSQSRKG